MTRIALLLVLGVAAAACHKESLLNDANNSPIRGANLLIHAAANEEMCVDAQSDPAEAHPKIWLFHCTGRENQRWTFADQGDGSSEILGVGGLCLDVQGRSSGDGTPLVLYPCTGANNQKFRHLVDGRLQEVQTGKCLTVNEYVERSPVFIDHCNDKPEPQAWAISPR
jgi:Ricin-type beta-trefoil lectin domain